LSDIEEGKMKKINLEIFVLEKNEPMHAGRTMFLINAIYSKDQVLRNLGNGKFQVIKDRSGYLEGLIK
jgi:hypothetical protein